MDRASPAYQYKKGMSQMKGKGALALLIVLTFWLILPSQAYAYIDPGTGSLIFQLIIAAFVGGLFTLKLFWHRIKKFFRSLKSEKHE